MKSKMRRPYELALLVPIAMLLSGCIGQTFDSVNSVNPFRTKEEVLAGERRAVNPAPVDDVAAGQVIIGAANPFPEWSQPGGNARNAPGHVSLAGSGSQAWRARGVVDGGKKSVRSASPPLIYGGRVFVYGANATVSSLSATGGKQWKVSLRPEKEKSASGPGGIAAGGNVIFAATGYSELVALSAENGDKLWTYDLEAPARTAPTFADGKVYVVTVTNVLHAVNSADGTEAWVVPSVGESEGLISAASPAVSGNTVVVPFSSGEIAAFDTNEGQFKWIDAVVRSTRTLAVSGLSDVAASPVIDDGVVYATGVAGRTIAVNLSKGERLWEQNVGSAYTPIVSGNALFLVDLNDNMVALDRKTGKTFWRSSLPVVRKKKFFSVWAGPSLAGGVLWAVSNDGNIISVDPSTGNILTNRKLGSKAYAKPTAAAGQLLVLAGDGSLIAYR